MEVAPFLREEVVDGRSATLVFFGTNQASRFVKSQVDLSFRTDWFAIDGDVVVKRIDPFA
jgi:hypothetical protein